MAIEITWLIPDKIVLSRWTGEVTVEDVEMMVEELGITFENSRHTIHSMIDLSNFSHTSREAMTAYLNSPIPTHPRRGRVAVVGSSSEAIDLADYVNSALKLDMVRLFETHEKARAFLLEHDTPPPALNSERDLSDDLPAYL
ncbi:MAG: STAS/SEC14 domain-containing protein [Anaerolineae bacterium]|nr:STAS/SEC14 domain-containing protein [Anaerolineae bacterium]